MIGTFDRIKYKEMIKSKGLKQQDIVDKLNDEYGISIGIGGVKSWTRTTLNSQGEIFQPNIKTLIAIADLCNCSIQDFFSDAEVQRKKITIEEITNNPTQYSNSISTAAESIMDKNESLLLSEFRLLNTEEQKDVLDKVKSIADEKLVF